MTLLPCNTRRDEIFALVVVPIANKILTHILHFTASESRAVVKTPVQHACFSSQKFNQFPNLAQ